MGQRLWLHQVQLLVGPGRPAVVDDALVEADGSLLAWGEPALEQARAQGLSPLALAGCWLAPALVDPHSVLEEPLDGRAETLASLLAAARQGGYGSVALLPWARPWRDRPERLLLPPPAGAEAQQLLLWGSFSRDGAEAELAPHGDQLAAGAVGLAGGEEVPPLPLLERGLRLAELGEAPLLLAPRDGSLTAGGFVREGVEALQAGWPPDPELSETLPLQALLSLAESLAPTPLRLMNLSTAAGVERLARCPQAWRPLATVSWWHLLADSGRLHPCSQGWRVVPSLGRPSDREALISALAGGVLTAVAVHHLALDPEEQLLPLDQRRAGLAGHGPVLPLLWRELVQQRGWPPAQLWQALCWGPSAVLGQPPPLLQPGSRRWLLFDPALAWPPGATAGPGPAAAARAANRPPPEWPGQGRIRASGLLPSAHWEL